MVEVGVAMEEAGQKQESRLSLSMKLLLFGFALTFVGVIVIMVSALLSGDAHVSGGAIIFVGPIPIIVGSGTDAFLAIVLATVLTIIGFVVFFWMRKQIPKS